MPPLAEIFPYLFSLVILGIGALFALAFGWLRSKPGNNGPKSFKIDLPGVKMEFSSQEKLGEMVLLKPAAISLLNLVATNLSRLDREVRTRKANIMKEAEITSEEIALALREGVTSCLPQNFQPYTNFILLQVKTTTLNKLKAYVKENKVPYHNEKDLEGYISSRVNHILVTLQSLLNDPLIVKNNTLEGVCPSRMEEVVNNSETQEDLQRIIIRFFRHFAQETKAIYELFEQEMRDLEEKAIKTLGEIDGNQFVQTLKTFSNLLVE